MVMEQSQLSMLFHLPFPYHSPVLVHLLSGGSGLDLVCSDRMASSGLFGTEGFPQMWDFPC